MRHLAGTRSGLVFEPVGPLDLKGLDQPVETSRVVWTPVDPLDDRPDFPTRLEAARSDTFVGRGTESEGLLDAWKTVEGDGRHCSVLLSGEPGIGKTALAARFAFDVFNRGAIVVYGRCDEDLGIPYQPWIEALTHLVEGISQATLAAHVADRGAHLARLVPQLARRLDTTVPPSTDSDAERFVLYGCVTDLLARVSVQLPVLVVLDDLHWADRPSLQLLRHVVTAEPPMRVEVLGTFRDSDISAGDPLSDLLAALHRDGCVERIALTGLNDLDVLSLLEDNSASFSDGFMNPKVARGRSLRLPSDASEVPGIKDREVGAAGHVLAQQTVGVLVGAALPWAVGIAEVNLDAGVDREVHVSVHLLSLVPGDRPNELFWQLLDRPAHGCVDLNRKRPSGRCNIHVAGGPLDEGAYSGLGVLPDDEVALPVPWDGSVVDL